MSLLGNSLGRSASNRPNLRRATSQGRLQVPAQASAPAQGAPSPVFRRRVDPPLQQNPVQGPTSNVMAGFAGGAASNDEESKISQGWGKFAEWFDSVFLNPQNPTGPVSDDPDAPVLEDPNLPAPDAPVDENNPSWIEEIWKKDPESYYPPEQAEAINLQQQAETDLGSPNANPRITVYRELSQGEWDALTPTQQQLVTANYILAQAREADQEITDGAPDEGYSSTVNSMFGEGLGSETYAPNTVQALLELGYENSAGIDLDQFINGATSLTYDQIRAGSYGGEEGMVGPTMTGGPNTTQQALGDFLATSGVWDDPTLRDSLDQGYSLIEAMRNGSMTRGLADIGFGPDPFSSLTSEDAEYLNRLFYDMANKETFAGLAQYPEFSEALAQDLQNANDYYGSDVVAQYMLANARSNSDFETFMTPEEFRATWLGGENNG